MQSRGSGALTRTAHDPVTDYAQGVVDGSIVAGPYVRESCARHLLDINEAPTRGLTWDLTAVDRVFGFFSTVLKLNGGEHEGRAFDLEPSQQFIVGSLFGWKREDGSRRFRTCFIEQGKGSGKTPLAAGIGHYMTCGADSEPRAETFAAAVDREQASVLFRDAVAMVKQSPALSKRATFSGGPGKEWNIAYLETASFFRPISSESSGRGKSGLRPHCVLLDEIHEHPTNSMVEFLRAGTKGRRQPLVFMITNSGVDRTSVAFDYHQYSIDVARGVKDDDSFFGYICSVDDGEDPLTDPDDPDLGYPLSWLKANPLLGVTLKPTYLREQVTQARGMPSKESVVRRLNFCQWVDAENPWIDGEMWRSCETEEAAPTHTGLVSLGLDLSSKRDLTAAARVTQGEDGVLWAEVRFWTPADTLAERERTDRVPYDAWVRAGYLIAVPGRSLNYGFVVRDLTDWLSEDDASLTFDPWRIEDFQASLDDAGIDSWMYEGPTTINTGGLRMVRHGQGFGGGASDKSLWMPKSITDLEDAILNNRLRVKRNPVLTWNNASAIVEQDAAENKKWSKRKSTGRIDGVVALCQAVGLAMQEDTAAPEPTVSVFGDTNHEESYEWI